MLGVHKSISSRSISLLRRVGLNKEITFTGGVANNIGMVEVMNENLDTKMNVSDESHFMGALGAALIAMDHIFESRIPMEATA